MADPALAPGPLTVRAARLRRDESRWLRELVLERANGTVQIEDLRAARGELEDMLRLQLYFTIKVKFQLEVLVPGQDPFGEGPQPPTNELYFLSPTAWIVEPEADLDRRMTGILEVARDKLEQPLGSSSVEGQSREHRGHQEDVCPRLSWQRHGQSSSSSSRE